MARQTIRLLKEHVRMTLKNIWLEVSRKLLEVVIAIDNFRQQSQRVCSMLYEFWCANLSLYKAAEQEQCIVRNAVTTGNIIHFDEKEAKNE